MDAARQLSKMFEPYHTLAYYCPEIGGFGDCRLPGLVARLLRVPLGPARPGTRTRRRGRLLQLRPPHGRPGHPRRLVRAATRSRSSPSAWSWSSGRCAGCWATASATPRWRGPHGSPAAPREGCDAAGRPLYAAHDARDWPDDPHLALWWACTLLARAPRRRAQRGARRGRGRRDRLPPADGGAGARQPGLDPAHPGVDRRGVDRGRRTARGPRLARPLGRVHGGGPTGPASHRGPHRPARLRAGAAARPRRCGRARPADGAVRHPVPRARQRARAAGLHPTCCRDEGARARTPPPEAEV